MNTSSISYMNNIRKYINKTEEQWKYEQLCVDVKFTLLKNSHENHINQEKCSLKRKYDEVMYNHDEFCFDLPNKKNNCNKNSRSNSH